MTDRSSDTRCMPWSTISLGHWYAEALFSVRLHGRLIVLRMRGRGSDVVVGPR
jgi:hypothetical protein